jgi:hypothetical protein
LGNTVNYIQPTPGNPNLDAANRFKQLQAAQPLAKLTKPVAKKVKVFLSAAVFPIPPPRKNAATKLVHVSGSAISFAYYH